MYNNKRDSICLLMTTPTPNILLTQSQRTNFQFLAHQDTYFILNGPQSKKFGHP